VPSSAGPPPLLPSSVVLVAAAPSSSPRRASGDDELVPSGALAAGPRSPASASEALTEIEKLSSKRCRVAGPSGGAAVNTSASLSAE
jgi:hypothetical protein